MPENLLWFSLYTDKEYVSSETPFADVGSIKGIKELEHNYKVILQELEEYLTSSSLKSHFNKTMVTKAKTWYVQGLRVWGLENYKKQRYFPKTMELLNAIPDVMLISFNLLDAQAKIKPHLGDTNAVIRCHLGLKIPATAPVCAIKVKNEIQGWEEGKVIGFIDAYQHEAWNSSDEQRIILLFDVLKPEYKKQKAKISTTIRTSLFLQIIGNYFPKLYSINRAKYKWIVIPFLIFYRTVNPLRNIYRYIRYKAL